MQAGGDGSAVADRIDQELHKPMNAATKSWMAAALKFPAETTPYQPFLAYYEGAHELQQYGYVIQRHLRGLDAYLVKLEACQGALGMTAATK